MQASNEAPCYTLPHLLSVLSLSLSVAPPLPPPKHTHTHTPLIPHTLSHTLYTPTPTPTQVGASQWFDLVDYDKLEPNRTFRVRKLTQFSDFKTQVTGLIGLGGF